MSLRWIVPALVCVMVPRPASAQDSLQIHHIDVDQGDATLVVAPNGRSLLIDSGLSSRGDTVAQFLEARGIDTLLVVHYDRPKIAISH